MSTTLVTRNVTVNGRRTSIRLEPEIWQALDEIVLHTGRSYHEFCSEALARRSRGTLTGAVRVAIVDFYRSHAFSAGKSGIRVVGGRDAADSVSAA